MALSDSLPTIRPIPSVRCELRSWDSAQVHKWAEEACRLVQTQPFNVGLRRTGRMLDYGAMETVSPAGTPAPVIWAIYQFDEPMAESLGRKPVIGLAVAYCPLAQAWEIWPLTTLDPAEIPLRRPDFGGTTMFFFGDPHPVRRTFNYILRIAEEGYCPVCHTYAPPVNPYAGLEESIYGVAAPGYICATCGKDLEEIL